VESAQGLKGIVTFLVDHRPVTRASRFRHGIGVKFGMVL